MGRFTKKYKEPKEINVDADDEENYYIGVLDSADPYEDRQRQKLAWNAFGKLEDGLEMAVDHAKTFVNDLQDEGDYTFASGIVSALYFLVDKETYIELKELLEKNNEKLCMKNKGTNK